MASGPPVTGLGDTEEELAVINGNQCGSFSLSGDSEASLHDRLPGQRHLLPQNPSY